MLKVRQVLGKILSTTTSLFQQNIKPKITQVPYRFCKFSKLRLLTVFSFSLTIYFLLRPAEIVLFRQSYISSTDPQQSGMYITNWFVSRNSIVFGPDYRIKPGTMLAEVRLESLLNIRKLVLFTVNEINMKLAAEGMLDSQCFKFWANPLSIQEFVEMDIANNPSKMLCIIKFNIEPGHLLFEAVIEKTIDRKILFENLRIVKQTELKLIYGKILDKEYGDSSICLGTKANFSNEESNIRQICLCKNKNSDFLLHKTQTVRKEWNATDAELSLWPPDVPMFVTSYFKYGTKYIYKHSPAKPRARYCKSTLKLLIMIHSSTTHYVRRRAIRETYGNKTLLQQEKVEFLFFLGKSNDSALQTNISKEVTEFDDIVQLNIVESYHNLTLKNLALYNWVYTFCKISYPKWIMKVDDDYLVNVGLAVKVIEANPNILLMGPKMCYRPRISAISHFKWYVPKYIYASQWYPCYLGGLAYFVQAQIIPQLLRASLSTPMIHVDDAYVTGLLAYQIGVCPVNLPNWFFSPPETLVNYFGDLDAKEKWDKLNERNYTLTAHGDSSNYEKGCLF